MLFRSLASTLLQVLAAHSPTAASPDPYQAFARALTSRAGIHDTSQLRAALGGSLAEALRTLTTAESGQDSTGSRWSRVTGLGHLTDGCGPLSGNHQSPSPAQAAALRAVALALTDGAAGEAAAAPGSDADALLRTVAATVTLVESRGKGQSPVGESIILALV